MGAAFVTPTMGRQELHPALYETFAAQTVPGKHLYVLDESKTPSPFFSGAEHRDVTYVHRQAQPRVDGVTRIGAARNFINGLVQEDVILHLDDDDSILPEYGAEMVARLGDAALCKLDVWRCLHSASGIVFEWDTRKGGGWHFAIRGAQVERVNVPSSDMDAEVMDAFHLGFGWSLCYPRSTWERFKFPEEGTEDIPWAQAIRDAGEKIVFVSDLPHLALHTVHVDPLHPNGGSAHFPQRMLNGLPQGDVRLRMRTRQRMMGALGKMTALPDGAPISVQPGRTYSILASVKKQHSLRSFVVRAEAKGVTIEQARDDVPASEFGVSPADGGYRLVHVIGRAAKVGTLPWQAPSFLRVLGEKSKVVKAWIDAAPPRMTAGLPPLVVLRRPR